MAGAEGGFMSEGSLDELGAVVLKSNLKREEGEVEEEAVRTVWDEIQNEKGKLPVFPVVEGERLALPRKLILSTETWKEVAWPEESVSMLSKKPSIET